MIGIGIDLSPSCHMVLGDKEHIVPGDYQREAEAQGISIHKLLEDKALFDQLYSKYVHLHDYFGRGENNGMKTLKKIKAETLCGQM